MALLFVQLLRQRGSPATITRCLKWLTKFVEKPGNLELIREKRVGERVVDLLTFASSNDKQLIEMIEAARLLVYRIARGNMSNLMKNLKLITETDDPKTLSLMKVYKKWQAWLESGLRLEIEQVVKVWYCTLH